MESHPLVFHFVGSHCNCFSLGAGTGNTAYGYTMYSAKKRW